MEPRGPQSVFKHGRYGVWCSGLSVAAGAGFSSNTADEEEIQMPNEAGAPSNLRALWLL